MGEDRWKGKGEMAGFKEEWVGSERREVRKGGNVGDIKEQ